MKLQTKDLTGVALDWAVAQCENVSVDIVKSVNGEIKQNNFLVLQPDDYGFETDYSPSTDWAQGGPIIERKKINFLYTDDQWEADVSADCFGFGGTMLKAGMRCYVASKLGNEVEVPEELL